MILILLLSFLTPPVHAALLAPDFQVNATSQDGTVFVSAKAAKGFHFNLEAPHSLEANSQKIKPSKETEAELDFRVERPTSLAINAYVCDDQKTFCEKHIVQASWDGKNLTLNHANIATASDEKPHASSTSSRDEHGFYVNQADAAFSEAALKKLPVMIDFYGIWCPPCNELNENVFGTRAFQKQAKNFVLLKMDADNDISWKLKDRYKIQGYPTLIFASSNGDEISRVVGYREVSLLVPSMKEAFRLKDEPFSKLKEKADQGDQIAADKLGLIYLDRAEYKNAVIYLTPTKKYPEKLLDAQIGAVSEKDDEASKKLSATLAKEAIAAHPHSPSALDWYSTLSKVQDGPEKDQALRGSVALSRELLGKLSSLKGFDLTKEDLLEEIAENLDDLKDPGAKQAWKDAALAYQAKIHSSDERGYNLENAYCLWKSGDDKSAREVYEKLRKRYPAEFTFHYSEARMEMQLDHVQAAEPLARTAYENSYGDNRLRATLLYAQVLKKVGKNKEAKETVAKTLASIDEKSIPDGVRSNRHLKALRDFEKE
jgi:thioredoxin-like negative regulator of GroEL